MVCRLVEQENIGLGIHDLAQTYLCLLTTTQNADLTLYMLCGQTTFCQCGTDLILCVGRKILPELFDTGGTVVAFDFLFKIADLEIFSQFSRTGKSRDQSEDTF